MAKQFEIDPIAMEIDAVIQANTMSRVWLDTPVTAPFEAPRAPHASNNLGKAILSCGFREQLHNAHNWPKPPAAA